LLSPQRPSLVAKIGRWLGLRSAVQCELPLQEQPAATDIEPAQKETLSRWRPWARRDEAIANLQQGFTTLTELMATIRENLEKQGRRQDEMLSYLSHLPEILQSLPEAQRIQGETLRAIGQQLQQQIGHQAQLAEIMAKVNDTSLSQKEILQGLYGKMETVGANNQAIADSLKQVGSAMETLGRSSESSTQILQHIRDDESWRQQQVQQAVQRQGTRFTILFVVAIVLAVAALVTTAVFAYLSLRGRG